eukprot:TRINITY_DN100534_c0_g1_i1.p1 TRINITY_DN100534_c0_g1~~TRINITY_DN100534_c0_g1_i1.p1  ORF type:complete len:798 (-),score=177.58 TRINITY_DN100534_c0_g1_i1:132-2525(-)
MKRSGQTPEDSSSQKRRAAAGPTLGAPRGRPKSSTYVTAGKVVVISEVEDVADPTAEVQHLAERLDSVRGCLLSSSYEYPGRYAQWSLGFSNPPVCLEAWQRRFRLKALNSRGMPIVSALSKVLKDLPAVKAGSFKQTADSAEGCVAEPEGFFSEEERSRQPSIFSVIRAIIEMFKSDQDPHLGLYGAFGYDLAFQFENVPLHQKREAEQRDVVLFIPDELLVVNHQARQAWRMRYDFVFSETSGMVSTKGLSAECQEVPFQPRTEMPSHISKREFAEGEFAKLVDKAKEKFARGDLFEAVLSQTFREPCKGKPSEIFFCLQKRNPSPYGFHINLGEGEYLVGASPEMFVRVESNLQGLRVETCPISGTIRRGKNALEDAENIRRILTDPKEESEITMCTDVDRNDKSRICEHGTVQVIGRRQIELYSRLIHTVDHVEGYLRPEFDAIDAFLVHTWAVTVCGAPKTWAMRFVEEMERSQRRWYGASVGHVAFDGHLNTGLTLRTIRIHDGVAEVRAGATLLYDSVPESEEAETELKASACLGVVRNPWDLKVPAAPAAPSPRDAVLNQKAGEGKLVLLIDHEDSFVHTLANYLRQTGATVTTVRYNQAEHALQAMPCLPDLAVLSPGPGRPSDFGVSKQIQRLVERKIPIFGVCLGLQGITEHFGGTLDQLSYPMHGKPSVVAVNSLEKEPRGSIIFEGCPSHFGVARYHSLYARRQALPDCLIETARLVAHDQEGINTGKAGDETKGENGANGAGLPVIMAIQHRTLPIAAVQFHPESILTEPMLGVQMLMNAFKL